MASPIGSAAADEEPGEGEEISEEFFEEEVTPEACYDPEIPGQDDGSGEGDDTGEEPQQDVPTQRVVPTYGSFTANSRAAASTQSTAINLARQDALNSLDRQVRTQKNTLSIGTRVLGVSQYCSPASFAYLVRTTWRGGVPILYTVEGSGTMSCRFETTYRD